MNVFYKTVRQAVVFFVGLAILLTGVALLVLPGPGILLIVVGLAVLAIEFTWARGGLARVRRWISDTSRRKRME